MSRLIAVTADEMLSGANSNVMGAYYSTDDEVPGVVVLAGTNKMPNPDLTDLDERGRLRGWDTKAPPAPDSWNVYERRLTSINANGSHTVLGGAPMLRQNESVLPLKQNTYTQDHPLFTDKSLPDISRDEPTDLAPPLETPRVDVITTSGTVGYPAGTLWCSCVGIVGDNPLGTPRITSCAPAVQLVGVAQGQVILFYLPDEVPDGWTGVGFCVGPSATTMKMQKRVDVRGKVITQVIDRGPYRRDGVVVTTTTNRTNMGSLNQWGNPRYWRASSGRTMRKGLYKLSYQLKTPQGWTADQQMQTVDINVDHQGEELAWVPPDAAKKQKDIVAWRPKFQGRDNRWYTFPDAVGEGYALSRAARLHTIDVSGWKGDSKPVRSDRQEADRSGMAGPTDAMEVPVAQGAQQMLPGRYAVRLTTASEKLGMESRPTPRAVVTLRDAGLAAGGAASFVTDQSLRVHRPMPQRIKNARLMEMDPVTGTQDLYWERFTNTGVTVTAADGFITVADTSVTATTVTYRRSSIEPINPARFHTLRYRMNATRWASGTIRMAIRFLDSTQTIIGSRVSLEDHRAVENGIQKYTFGPANGTAHYDIPMIANGDAADTAYVQVDVVGVGATGDTRNFDFSVSNIGLFVGRTTPRKLYDLELAEDTPGHDVWPVPDVEDATVPYPGGPYCRVVENPTDPATLRSYTLLENKGFEDNSATSGTWTVVNTTGGSFTLSTLHALRGLYGARSNVLSTSAIGWGAHIWKDYLLTNRSTFGYEAAARLKSLPSAGTAELLSVTRDATLANYLAAVRISSAGAVTLLYWNGTAVATLATSVTAQKGDDLRFELVFSGLRTAAGSVSLRIKRNARVVGTFTQSGLAWGTVGNVNRVLAGWHGGSTAAATAQALIDRIRITSAGITETTNLLGNYVEYWAPEQQPAGDEDYFMTGARVPVKPATAYCFSAYIGYDGISTPSGGASLFRLVSKDVKGETLQDHGYLATGLLGRDYWDRYSLAYTTPAGAAYVEIERNHVGDGLIRAMAFQHETGSTPSAFSNTHGTSGTFNVIYKTTFTGGPKGGDTSFHKAVRRIRAVATHRYDVNGVALTTTTWRARAAASTASLTTTAWVTDATLIPSAYEYLEVEVTLTTTDATLSPEVRAVFADLVPGRPVLLMQDGRPFDGGAIAYQLTPASPIPNTIRKEYADGSKGMENVGRGNPPERLKLSVQAFTATGKRQIEANPATEEPLYRVEVPHLDTAYTIAATPELAGNVELEPDGTEYWDYVAEGIEADVVSTEDL